MSTAYWDTTFDFLNIFTQIYYSVEFIVEQHTTIKHITYIIFSLLDEFLLIFVFKKYECK